MTNLEDINREQEKIMNAGMENPDNLAHGKDTVGADIDGTIKPPVNEEAPNSLGAAEDQKFSDLQSAIQDKASQIEAAGGVAPNITPSSYFKGKSESALKDVLSALDKELDKALSAGSPEAMATAMFWAVLNAPFSAANAWLDHHKKDKQRLDKEYADNTAQHDRDMGVNIIEKFMIGWDEVMKSLPPEYAQNYLDKDGRLDKKKMPKEAWENLRKLTLKNPNVWGAIEARCGRQIEQAEREKISKGMFGFVGDKAPPVLPNQKKEEEPKPQAATVEDIKNLKEAILSLGQNVADLNNILKAGQEQHRDNKSYEKEGEALEANRASLDRTLGKNGRVINGGRTFTQSHKKTR